MAGGSGVTGSDWLALLASLILAKAVVGFIQALTSWKLLGSHDARKLTHKGEHGGHSI